MSTLQARVQSGPLLVGRLIARRERSWAGEEGKIGGEKTGLGGLSELKKRVKKRFFFFW